MRIVIVNATRRKVGGVESYLEQLLPAWEAQEHEAACLFESGADAASDGIRIRHEVPTWQADPSNATTALQALQAWKPDLIFLHSQIDPSLKDRLLSIAPGVFYAHNYCGTCISGTKRHAFPQAWVCHKVFSPACLAHYFPRRCGGLNPLTMVRRYRVERAWLEELRDFAAIVVASEHMALEYRRHGFQNVAVAGLPVRSHPDASARRLPLDQREPLQLLFVGRMESYKGGKVLLDALPEARRKLGRNLRLVFAGDGRQRRNWEVHAKAIADRNTGVEVEFAGWLSGAFMDEAMRRSHLLVLPSQWPEPFGLVGLEAGRHGLPTAAFDVGGISDWLKEGVNGHLAPGDPPAASDLANTIFRCLFDEAHYTKLAEGALEAVQGFSMAQHFEKLLPVLSRSAFPHL